MKKWKRGNEEQKSSFLWSFPTYAKWVNVVGPPCRSDICSFGSAPPFPQVGSRLGKSRTAAGASAIPSQPSVCNTGKKTFLVQTDSDIVKITYAYRVSPPPPPPQGPPFSSFQNKFLFTTMACKTKVAPDFPRSDSSSCLYQGKYPRVVVSLYLPSLDSWWFVFSLFEDNMNNSVSAKPEEKNCTSCCAILMQLPA